jgi:hypothetical protein
MATLRDGVMPVINVGRVLVDTLGLRQFTITVRTRTWTGGPGGPQKRLGTSTDVDLVLVPKPKVKELAEGTILVGPITPKTSTGTVGYLPSQLNPADVAGVEFYWLVEGPFASGVTSAAYIPVAVDTSKPFRYMITCQTLNRARPF